MPRLIEKLTGLGVCHIECGAQFSVALTSSGHVIFILNNLFRFLLVMPFFNCDVYVCGPCISFKNSGLLLGKRRLFQIR